ncbi:MAG: hypothetical protein INR71_12940 [Terriglobus roseus]|nr:hypothetical protein [Terriglobus roseus]
MLTFPLAMAFRPDCGLLTDLLSTLCHGIARVLFLASDAALERALPRPAIIED